MRGAGVGSGRAASAPDAPGDYLYMCTFPGHWRTMNGSMEVTEKVPGTRE